MEIERCGIGEMYGCPGRSFTQARERMQETVEMYGCGTEKGWTRHGMTSMSFREPMTVSFTKLCISSLTKFSPFVALHHLLLLIGHCAGHTAHKRATFIVLSPGF